ncbi:SDR family NAD(P)-dependent oxidoreductase [Saxibacter everestensis]|uniref:SDR family NAD(P)-dependent oxidoreductase n=1 Tax=Saxibacter everestensis TaxID=2909229 RepID=A0ABY8QSC7_9MICO|nr:SDR family NAD(P)-dependent oxidoreductase [Brevibacteriaceae bacterium ZFBP1038]
MSERTVVITGASDGIGAAAAGQLHALGFRVVVVGRSAEKSAAVAERLGADHLTADFSNLDDVRALADAINERYPRIDALLNNAGGVMGKRRHTDDGYELTLQVNHLAPFLLTNLLLGKLLASDATVVNTSSVANRVWGKININDLGNANRYTPHKAYGDAKLMNLLFTRELHRRFHQDGLNAAAFHPGVIATNFAAGSASLLRPLYRNPIAGRILGTPVQGADTMVWLTVARPGTDWKPGEYYAGRKRARANRQADDPALAAELWDHSAAMVGLK